MRSRLAYFVGDLISFWVGRTNIHVDLVIIRAIIVDINYD